MSQSIENSVKNRIYRKRRRWCFTPKNFNDLRNSDTINTALHRLEIKRFIRRLTHSLYDYPKRHEQLGVLPPDIEKIVELSLKNIKLQFSLLEPMLET